MLEEKRSITFVAVFYLLPLLVIALAALALDGNILVVLLASFWLGLGVVLGGSGEGATRGT